MGTPKTVTVRDRINIVLLHAQGKSLREIAAALQLSPSAVRRWVVKWESGDDMEDKAKPGRPRLLTTQAKLYARKLLKTPGFGGLSRAARTLQSKGLTLKVVHASTLSRMLRGSDMKLPTRLVPDTSEPSRGLAEVDKERRLDFAEANISRDWDNVMFTDRKRFYHKFPGCKVPRIQWREQGQKRVARRACNPKCVNVYMGITKYGATTPVLVSGTSKQHSTFHTKTGKPARNITKAEYNNKVLKSRLLPDGDKLMRENGHNNWVFQQDNDPAHSDAGAEIHSYNRQHATHIQLLPNWPPYSPDLNLIENWWAMVDQKMDEMGCKTFEEYKTELCKALQSIPKRWLLKAYTGMAQRLEDTIQLKGDKTKH